MVVKEVTIIELNEILEKSPIPIILETCADHPICKTTREHFNQLSKKYNGRIAFLRININKQPEILKIFNIGIPAYIAFDRGQIINAWQNPTLYQLTNIVKEISRIT